MLFKTTGHFLFQAVLIFVTGSFIFSCSGIKKNKTHQNISNENIERGKQLAAIYCGNCHMLPDPSLLGSKNWENGVLPAMGPRLGIFFYGFKEYPSSMNDKYIGKNYYPSKQVIGFVDWQNIIDYYTSLSPDSLIIPQREVAVKSNDQLFSIEKAAGLKTIPATCLVKINTQNLPNQLLIGDVMSRALYCFNEKFERIDSFKTSSPVVDVDFNGKEMITTNIGVMGPNNGRFGEAMKVSFNSLGKMVSDSSLQMEKLGRPVQTTKVDINKDGKDDYVVCEFGNLIGALSWMENMGNNKFERHIIREVPGAIKTYISDVNHDGLPDIWALFAQADEGIFLFTNKGNGKFDQEQVLRFPSIYGSSFFEMIDFNKDGHPDIIYTCGDNADYSAVLKPYHGIYIFLNDGTNHFKQKYFFPMHGCYKALARDFDGDGDLDIAAISFFADYKNHPEESFIYLENKGDYKFQPYSIPGTECGRWLTMDAGDIDGDGKTDLVLGNFSLAPSFIKSSFDWKTGPPFLILKNKIKSAKL